MTEKEFSKLRRRELLELLLMQTREQKQIEEQVAEKTKRVHELEQMLNTKDSLIEELQARLAEGKSDGLTEDLPDGKNEQNEKPETSFTEQGDYNTELKEHQTMESEQTEKWKDAMDDRDSKIEELVYTIKKKVGIDGTQAILLNVLQLIDKKSGG